MQRFGLRDDQWDRIRDLLPGQEGHRGVTAADNRRFVEAVLYRYRTGIPWRDLPERFGKSRHGAPERNFQITASTNRRFPSSLLRPTVPGRPGRRVSIRANWSSRNP